MKCLIKQKKWVNVSTFQLDIITPISIQSFSDVSYLRIPGLDGLIGVQSKHANSIIALDIGEIKITINGKNKYFSTSGGFSDIKKESVQLLLETIESIDNIDKARSENALKRAKENYTDKSMDLQRAKKSIKRAENRLKLIKKL